MSLPSVRIISGVASRLMLFGFIGLIVAMPVVGAQRSVPGSGTPMFLVPNAPAWLVMVIVAVSAWLPTNSRLGVAATKETEDMNRERTGRYDLTSVEGACPACGGER